MRRLLPFLALSTVAVAVAAPVPKLNQEQRRTRLFGEVVDAPKGYRFTLAGDRLVVDMAANASASIEEAPPRTEREVTGDFEMTVVLTLAPPETKLKDAGKNPHLIAGLGVWGKGPRFVTHAPCYGDIGKGRNSNGWGFGETGYVKYEDDRAWSSWCAHLDYRAFEKRHLILRREGRKHWYGDSEDGKEWSLWAGEPCDLPDTVGVGVFAVNTTAADCTATFSDFVVTPLPKE